MLWQKELKKATARNMAKKTKVRKPRRDPKSSPKPDNADSNAGRSFHYQDAVSAWLAAAIWTGQRAPAIVIPEGGDDIELRDEATSFVQVKSGCEHLGTIRKARQPDTLKIYGIGRSPPRRGRSDWNSFLSGRRRASVLSMTTPQSV